VNCTSYIWQSDGQLLLIEQHEVLRQLAISCTIMSRHWMATVPTGCGLWCSTSVGVAKLMFVHNGKANLSSMEMDAVMYNLGHVHKI